MLASFNYVEVWWISLIIISIFNISLWYHVVRTRITYTFDITTLQLNYWKWQIYLSGIYTFGCAFRSILPRADIQRIVLYDHWLSSVLVGRSVATIAELCFALQWALLIFLLCRQNKHPYLEKVPYLILFFIILAECFSWHAVISTNYLSHVVEESLWALSTFLIVITISLLCKHFNYKARRILSLILVASISYLLFLIFIDIPMYFNRWQGEELLSKPYFSLQEGLRDLTSRWIVTFDWQTWKDEAIWMTLYFSAGVWFSISLISLPSKLTRIKKPKPKSSL